KDTTRLFQVIERLRSSGLSIVYISHFLEEVQRVAGCYTVLRDGKVAGSGLMAEATLRSIVSLMVGRELREMFPRTSHTLGETLLEIEGLAGTRLPRGVSLSLRRGEILGVAGLIGSGRSELLRAVFGLEQVWSGRIRVAMADSAHASPHERIRQGLGLLSE